MNRKVWIACRVFGLRIAFLAGGISVPTIGIAQELPNLPRTEICTSKSSETAGSLKQRRRAVERQMNAGTRDARSRRKMQEDLLQLTFQVECARLMQIEAEALRRRNKSLRHAQSERTTKETIEITIYYATNRKPSGSADPAFYYGGEPKIDLEFGRAVVSIPPTHQPGNLELPTLWKLERQSQTDRHFVLKSVSPLAPDLARSELIERLQNAGTKALLIFVHGYNSTFEAASLRTAQLAHDLRFPGVPLLFSWPSIGQTTGYWQDEEAARLSETAFENLLDELSQYPIDDVYVVAHSMGNRIVGHAIQARSDKGKQTDFIRELLLAAPDINVEIFRTVIAPKLAAMQQTRTTIYAASADLALKASKYVHGYKRVGDSAGGVFVYSGLHSVDASAAASSIRSYGHAYVMDSLALLKDVRMIIGERGEPLARGLLQMGQSPEQYWRLP